MYWRIGRWVLGKDWEGVNEDRGHKKWEWASLFLEGLVGGITG